MRWNLFLMTLILGSLPVSLSSAQNASFFNRNFPLITETGNYLGSPACIIQTYWLKSYSLDKLCQPAINQDNIPPVQVPLPITTQNPPAKSSNLPTQNNLPPNSSLPSGTNPATSSPPNNSPSSPAVIEQPTTQPSTYQRFRELQPSP